MRTILVTFFLLQGFCSLSQTWQSINVKAMNPFVSTYSGLGTGNNRYFRINPYNNHIWLTYADAVQQLTSDGDYFYYNNSNTPLFPTNADFRDFAFTPQYTFALSENYGLYQLDENIWNLAIPFDKGINMTYDADTVWCIRQNQNYMKWYGGFNSTGSHLANSKAEIKKRLFWTGDDNSAILRWENDLYTVYSPDTTVLMDWGCWDMKFYPGTDSLFVANDAGFAIADGITFIDSICATNCTNMPTGIILEFEFDANNNIWALIGNSGLYYKDALAHYNVSTKVWDQYYDENNSPIDFNTPNVSIEMDNLGNLWVVDRQLLHVLDEGNAPQWVGMEEYHSPLSVSIFPNPSNELVSINFEGQQAKLMIYDTQGKIIQTSTVLAGEQFSIADLEKGIYFFEITNEEGKAVKRAVKN